MKHEFVVHNILIDVQCYGSDFLTQEVILNFVGFETILINEILHVFQYTITIFKYMNYSLKKKRYYSEEFVH